VALGRQIGLDPSHIYRIEVGGRRTSRETAERLADALAIVGTALDEWVMAAGYAPTPFATAVRSAVRTRGGGRRPASQASEAVHRDTMLRRRLESMGLQEPRVGRLLRAMQSAGPPASDDVARSVTTALGRVTDRLEAPVKAAIIPAAGGQHRLVAPHVMQRLLLRTIREATESGIGQVILIVAPGMSDALFAPLKDALDLSVIPSVTLCCAVQVKPEGLGDAVLRAEGEVKHEPFAVLLPDDVVHRRTGRAAGRFLLQSMMTAFKQLDGGHLIAVTSVSKTKMARCGVAKLAGKEVIAKVFPVKQLVERPEPDDPICRDPRALGVVGRYLLQPGVFRALRELRSKRSERLELTDALERLREKGQDVYAFETAAAREDIGEVLDHAESLIRE
jgi:UTP--glucose-1-phosphate uridylyltransferase